MAEFEIWQNVSNNRIVIRKADDDNCTTGSERIYPGGLLVITEEQREAVEGRAVSAALNLFANGTLELVSTGGGGADLSDATPAPLGVAAAGAGAKASREDHVHAMPTAADVGAVPQAQPINAQTATTYTLVASDAGKLVTLSNAAAVTLTLPKDADASIAVGTYIDVVQLGAGQVTVVAGSGATLRVSGATAKARAQYSRLGVQKIAADTWSVFGDLAAS